MNVKSVVRLGGLFGLLGVVSIGTSGCSGLGSALGMEKTSPDEFAVVTKAPLIIPPDFSLRPPQPGAKRPNEPVPAEVASDSLFKTAGHETSPREPSQGESTLVELAGASDTDGSIRSIVEEDYAESIEEPKTGLSRLNPFSRSDEDVPPPTVEGSAEKPAEQANQRYLEREKRKTFAERVFFWREDKDEEEKADAEEEETSVNSDAEAAPTTPVESEDISEESSEEEAS